MDGGFVDQLAVFGVVVKKPVTNRGQLLFFRHERSATDSHTFRRNMKVVAGTGGLAKATMRPPGGNVVFVGPLVVGKTCIAIDAKERLLRRPHMLGREVEH